MRGAKQILLLLVLGLSGLAVPPSTDGCALPYAAFEASCVSDCCPVKECCAVRGSSPSEQPLATSLVGSQIAINLVPTALVAVSVFLSQDRSLRILSETSADSRLKRVFLCTFLI